MDKTQRDRLRTALLTEKRRREGLDAARALQSQRGGLLPFVRYFWHVLEPETEFVDGWPLEAVCDHLEAVTFGDINRLLITVPPGFMKSLLTDVFWPAWEWGPMEMGFLRYVAFSYSATLTERDNGRFRDLMMSPEYQEMWGSKFVLRKTGERKVTNSRHGWKLASSVGGVGTGERGNRVILDDPHNIKQAESDPVREETVRWFREAMSNRLNDMDEDAIVIIEQRSHEADVAGVALDLDLGYTHLMIPMEYDPQRHCSTEIGWEDPRTEDGDLAWSGRFPPDVVRKIKATVGSYAYSGQYQQAPSPRGGGILKRDWWQLYPPEGEAFDPNTNRPMTPLTYPPMDYIVASVDTAMSTKEENDFSAMTVWGSWRNEHDLPKIMLMDAWKERLEFKGLVDRIIQTCKDQRVDRLLIEAKANGISVGQEIGRLMRGQDFACSLVNPVGDKVSRAYAVTSMFEAGLIYAPDRKWADMVIDEMAAFNKGAYDDFVDSSVQALKHMRDIGVALLREERELDLQRRYGLPTGKQKAALPYRV